MTSQYGSSSYGGGGGGGYGSGSGSGQPPSSGYRYGSDPSGQQQPERGARRRKLAAMAGSLYRAGAAAASEIKEQYNNTRIRNLEPFDSSSVSIPGSFPQVSIIHAGDEQMVLFPSYAKRHVRLYGKGNNGNAGYDSGFENNGGGNGGAGAMNDSEYWRHEWAKAEDEKAVVDVDVRGWIYMPSRGPMTRRNRMLIGLARRLSGIPAPTIQPDPSASEQERIREERRIAREAQEIERRGQSEREVAHRGGYSEKPAAADEDSGPELDRTASKRSGSHTPNSPPDSPALLARPSFAASELSDAELSTANANLMARIGPFMTTPLVNLPITVFFYNDEQSQSRTVETNDSGHFTLRAPLDFVPTHVRVLVNENISATQPVQIIEPRGISLISDIDDTIKRSNISLGAREIFRNTFIRDLADLTIEGVKEWYNSLHNMGIKVHYCSNSPWQLFPVLATFFHTAGLPPGSIHLKQYSGMLQGIFEPVAERKKGTLERILRDFPERRFLLVGDSGEADLEVYTELAVAHPGRILGVFIRDVTTPELTQGAGAGFFDSGFSLDANGQRVQRTNTTSGSGGGRVKFEDQQQRSGSLRPDPPPRIVSAPSRQQQPPPPGPAVGTLIDFSDEPEQISPTDTRQRNPSGASSSAVDLLAGTTASKKPPPPRPAKPKALRSSPSDLALRTDNTRSSSASGGVSPGGGSPHPLTQVSSLPSRQGSGSGSGTPPPPPPPRRRGTGTPNPTSSSQGQQREEKILPPPPPPPQRRTTNLNSSTGAHYSGGNKNDYRNNDESGYPNFATNTAEDIGATVLTGHGITNVASGGNGGNGSGGYGAGAAGGGTSDAVNKKLELWHRRLARAHEILDEQGVPLYTWRRGEDVIKEAEGIVREALRGIGLSTPGGQNPRK